MKNEKREVKSFRVKPSTQEKMNIIRMHLSLDTTFWNKNTHTRNLGYSYKNVTTADVVEIAINNLYNQIFPDRK